MLRRTASRVAAAAVALLGLVVLAQPAGAAPGLIYVNMGDSYSAGYGIAPAASGAPAQCRQSAANWARNLAQQRGYQLTDVSCTGAATKDVSTAQFAGVGPQIDALSASTQLVTMTIGGNDENVFFGAISKCATEAAKTGGQGSPCQTAYGQSFRNTIVMTVYPNIVKTLRAVRAKAPIAKIGISAYLQILPATTGCYPTMPIAVGDVPYLYGLQGTLNDVIMRSANATGVTFVDQAASVAHDACRPVGIRWVEPVNGTRYAAQAHPNAAGEQAMANRASALLGLG